MKKEKLNLSCPQCSSENIILRKKQNTMTDSRKENPIQLNPITYECECQNCHHKFELKQGYETQITCAKPVPIDGYKNVELLASYKSDSPFDLNYKIVTIHNKEDESYLLFVEDQQYPILLSKQNVPDIIDEPPKVLTLIKQNKE